MHVTIRQGTCHAIYAFDVASSINLEAAARRLSSTERLALGEKRGPAAYFEYRPLPLRLAWTVPQVTVNGMVTRDQIEVVMYDFGAVSLAFRIPLSGPLPDLLPLAGAVRAHPGLLAASRSCIERLLELLQDAAVRPQLASFVEDYAIFEIAGLEPSQSLHELTSTHSGLIAQILRAEPRPLSQQEIAESTGMRASYGPNDIAVIDTDAALVIDPDAADIRALLEFANAQLLEMRLLDQQLDDALEQSYQLLSRQRWGGRMWRRLNPDVRAVAELQLDAAILFERVTNSLKLIGEQYLSRIYGLASRRFRLADWDASITRKLETVESIYGKLADRAAVRRMEILEWIIIMLFALDILLSL